MSNKRIIILGAGLSGLSSAWHLEKKGIECRILEKESSIGGLCRSNTTGGFTFDVDGHLLHFKHRYTYDLVNGLLEDNLEGHKRSAWVHIYDRFIQYPFQANLHGLPSSVIKECLIGFISVCNNGHYRKDKGKNFLDWINHTLGKGIAKHFMVPYNTKFWTVHPRELTCEWLDGFVPVPSLNRIIEGTVEESRHLLGYNTLFWYPKKGGIAELPYAFASEIKRIHNDCEVIEIDIKRKEVKLANGERERFDYLVSSLPLPELPALIKTIPKETRSIFKKLKWNSIFNLNLGVEGKGSLNRHWIYFPQKEIHFFRVGFFHNFSSSIVPAGKRSLYIEVSYSKDNPIDKNRIREQIKRDLIKTGILKREDIICCENANDIRYGYPVYNRDYLDAREKIIQFLLRHNIFPSGRYGSWKYMSMEDVILEGKIISDKISHI